MAKRRKLIRCEKGTSQADPTGSPLVTSIPRFWKTVVQSGLVSMSGGGGQL